MSNPTKLQRFLDLIAFLVGRRFPVSADELMRGIPAYAERWASDDDTARETARRTFERDKDELRRLGIPLRTVRYTVDGQDAEGYMIDRHDFYLPYLKLVRDGAPEPARHSDHQRPAEVPIAEIDAPLALEALRRVADVPAFPFVREARSAFRKLAFDLDPIAFQRTSPVLFLEPPGSAELADRLRILSDALLARKRIDFVYHGIYRGTPTERSVEPYGLLMQGGHWYLIGHDLGRGAVRVFRAGRMEKIEPNRKAPNKPDYAAPVGFRLSEYAGRAAWELGKEEHDDPVIARVLFRFPLSLWAARNAHGTLEQQHDDGSSVRIFELHQVPPFVRWILSHEGDAEIVSPPELQAEVRSVARAIASAHSEAPDVR